MRSLTEPVPGTRCRWRSGAAGRRASIHTSTGNELPSSFMPFAAASRYCAGTLVDRLLQVDLGVVVVGRRAVDVVVADAAHVARAAERLRACRPGSASRRSAPSRGEVDRRPSPCRGARRRHARPSSAPMFMYIEPSTMRISISPATTPPASVDMSTRSDRGLVLEVDGAVDRHVDLLAAERDGHASRTASPSSRRPRRRAAPATSATVETFDDCEDLVAAFPPIRCRTRASVSTTRIPATNERRIDFPPGRQSDPRYRRPRDHLDRRNANGPPRRAARSDESAGGAGTRSPCRPCRPCRHRASPERLPSRACRPRRPRW